VLAFDQHHYVCFLVAGACCEHGSHESLWIVQVMDRLIKEVQAQAVLYQESVRDASELEDVTGVELFQGGIGSKARPMVVIKQVSTKANTFLML